MKKIGFDNDKYLKMQSEHIRERISKFGDKLTLNSVANSLMTIMHHVFFLVSNLTVNFRCSSSLRTKLRLLL